MTIPIMVLTGFLGSGKTTLLRHLLHDARMSRTAVIINEFGEIGIDHELVEASDENFIQLTTGCLCCKVRSDLVLTLCDLAHRRAIGTVPPFERVVIETSGLADPAPILHALLTDSKIVHDYALTSIVTTADAVSGIRMLEEHEQSRRQAASADHIIITKCDLPDENSAALRSHLIALNPRATIYVGAPGTLDIEVLFDGSYSLTSQSEKIQKWLKTQIAAPQVSAPSHIHSRNITSFFLVREAPIHAVTLSLFLEALANNCGADLLRVKGLIQVLERPDEPAVIQGVQHVFYPPSWLERWPSEERTTRIVFIGKNISSEWVSALLELIELEVSDETARHKATLRQT